MRKYLLTYEQMESIADSFDAMCSDRCVGAFDPETGELYIATYGSKNVVVTAEEVK